MLELFPTAVLDTSILTSVLVGLLVVWLLQEWLGWGLSALVVPGYLASVLAIQPLTAAVMVGESIATWLVMVALSDALPRWWPWFPLFGRDRFFLALLASVGVRLGMEGALLPLMSEQLGLSISSELHSMGLVIVPLLAYAIWRNGPVRALPRLGVPLLLTWAVLDLVLLSWTNLSLASFELTYEDLARDFVSSPRAYVLLLTGAWLGSLTNLRYGWDFGGIIVPGLLALCWLQPERLAATVGEAVVIAVALQVLLRTRGLARLNLAGGRLLILGMLVGYLLKWGLGHLLGAGWPGLRLRQLFGFGYLLPTLMALRMVRSGDPMRTLVPSLLTSLAGFAGGTALAWSLAVLLPPPAEVEAGGPQDAPSAEALLLAAWEDRGPVPLELDRDLDRALADGKATLLTGGGGFGGIWVRAEGEDVAVVGRVGEVGAGEAVLALAERTDARVVQLCGPVGGACEAAREQLEEVLPLVEVEELPTTRLDLAATWQAAAPGPWEHPAWAPLEPQPLPRPGAAALAAQSLARPLLRWASGQGHADAALDLAAATAHRLGAHLGVEGDRVSVIAPDWRMVVQRGGQPSVVELPFADDAPGLVPLSLGLAVAEDAVAWVADAPPTWRNQAHGTERLAHHLVLGLLEELGAQGRVLSLQGLRDLQDPGGQVVLTLGRPQGPDSPPPPMLADWSTRLDQLGLSPVVYDGSAGRMSFRGGQQPLRRAARAATGQDAWLGLYLGSRLRSRTLPLDPRHRLHDLLVGTELPRWQLQAQALDSAGGPPDADWQPWLDAAAALSRDGQSTSLQRLERESRRRGARLGLACEPLAGCRWLAALRCTDERCDGVLAPLSDLPATPTPLAPPRERLLLGDGRLGLHDLARPARVQP